MSKRVLSIGQCGPDHRALSAFLNQHFEVTIDTAKLADEALAKIRTEPYDLVLVNRKLDEDYSDGMEIIRNMLADPDINTTPVMLVSNYPEAQEEAVGVGAEYGFGKWQYREAEVVERVRKVLG